MLASIRWLAGHAGSAHDRVRLIDGTRVVCGMSRETVGRCDLSGYCGCGHDGSHSAYYSACYWGVKLMPLVTVDGLITGFILVNPTMCGQLEARLMMLGVPDNRPPPGSTVVGDKWVTRHRGVDFEARLLPEGIVLIWHNWAISAERKRSLIAFDH